MTTGEAPRPFSPVQAIALATVFTSSSAILIRFTTAAPVSVAGWRLLLATLVLAAFPGARHGLAGVARRDAFLLAVAGVLLAAHFSAWIASLRVLPVAVSVLLVSTHPLFILLHRVFSGARLLAREYAGITVAFLGLYVMRPGGADPSATGLQAIGAAFAVAGSLALAGYLLIGAEVRRRVPAASFLMAVSGAAALTLFGFLLGGGGRAVPLSPRELTLYAILALGPTIAGHGLYAWAIRFLGPLAISAAFLAEPVLASLLAVPAFGEIPSARTIGGGALVLLGLAMVLARPDAGDPPPNL